ncbi:MBL fold metallo-hydrolase [Pseudoalteromonas fenneropenaei]|uniref:MBL fold metallo-hydrolase n=1 Tax=Pseudoalteromonas fenneropenaei TaxID=1737459 RepID=A0ABV7CGJ6_9GAMM
MTRINCLLFTVILMVMAVSSPYVAAKTEVPQVYRFVSNETAYEANAYLLKTNQGWLLFDSLMLKSDVEPIIATIKASKLPLLGIFITHPHVDHFAGVAPIVAALGEVPVYATAKTRTDLIAEHQNAIKAGWLEVFGEDYERTLVAPNKELKDGELLEIAGISVKVIELGAGEAANHTLFIVPQLQQAFSGDALVASYAIYVGEGRSAELLALYDKVQPLLQAVKLVRPGHGGAMEPGRIVESNRQQVVMMREAAQHVLAQQTQTPDSAPPNSVLQRQLTQQIVTKLNAISSYGMPLPQLIGGYNSAGLLNEISKANELRKKSDVRQ